MARITAKTLLPALILLPPILLIYFGNLQQAPVYLSHDEIVFGSHGHAISTTGRDLNGRLLPLFFHVGGGYWATPVTIYLMALFQKALPLSEITIRLPTVVVGVTNLVLLYFIARRVFRRSWLAFVAAVVLALTPAHFIHSRLAVDHLYPLPFVLVWLLCLHLVLQRFRPAVLFAGTLTLGIGFYSYLAAVILMPVYFLITCLVIYQTYGRSPRYYLPAVVGFFLPLSLLVPWLIAHPNQFADQVMMYRVYDSSRFGVLQGLKEMLSWTGLTARSDVYYSFFNPSFLFFAGASSLINSTRQAGVFLLPMAILLPLGLYRIVTAHNTPFNRALVLGFASAPLASVVVAEVAINRGLVMLPYAALIATFGVEYLLSASKRAWRVVGVALLTVMPLQFASFYRDYHGDYRRRSSLWFEGNIRGAIEEVVSRTSQHQPPAVYLSTDIDWMAWYWRFYLNKHHRPDLFARTVYFDPKTLDVHTVPSGSVVLTRTDAISQTIFGNARLKVTPIAEPSGGASLFEVFER